MEKALQLGGPSAKSKGRRVRHSKRAKVSAQGDMSCSKGSAKGVYSVKEVETHRGRRC